MINAASLRRISKCCVNFAHPTAALCHPSSVPSSNWKEIRARENLRGAQKFFFFRELRIELASLLLMPTSCVYFTFVIVVVCCWQDPRVVVCLQRELSLHHPLLTNIRTGFAFVCLCRDNLPMVCSDSSLDEPSKCSGNNLFIMSLC